MSDHLVKYPAWRYHATEPAKIIRSAAEEQDGWGDCPVPQSATSGAAAAPAALSPAGEPSPPAPPADAVTGGIIYLPPPVPVPDPPPPTPPTPKNRFLVKDRHA